MILGSVLAKLLMTESVIFEAVKAVHATYEPLLDNASLDQLHAEYKVWGALWNNSDSPGVGNMCFKQLPT